MGYRGIPQATSPTQRFTLNINLVPQEPLGMGGEPSDGAWPEDGLRAQGAPGCGICKVNSCTQALSPQPQELGSSTLVFGIRALSEEIRNRGYADALSVPTSHLWLSLKITTEMWYIGSNCSNCKFNTQKIPVTERAEEKNHFKNPFGFFSIQS